MARATLVQNAFTQGELTPLLNGRFDAASLYNNGCSTLENFIIYPQGGARKRQGTKYIAEAHDPDNFVRLIPFEFSETEAYVLEFGEKYIRFYTDGGIVTSSGVPYRITTPYAADDLQAIKYVQAADTYYLAHPSYPVKKLVRNDNTDWVISDVEFVNGPFLDENITNITITPSAVSGTITLSGSVDIFNIFQEDAFFRLATPLTETATISGTGGFTTAMELDKGDTITVSAIGTTWGAVISVQKSVDEGASWTDAYISSSNFAVQITETLNDDTFYRIGVSDANYVSGSVNVSMENTDAWGYVQITNYVSAQEVDAYVIRTLPSTDATKKWSEGAWSAYRGYPAAIAFFEQRLILAGSDYEPQDIWASVINDYENFKPGLLDNAAYNFTLVSNSLNKILWLLENRVLHAGTLGGEWKFGYPDQPTTPTNVDAKNQTSDGSANIQSIVINNNIIFVQKGGKVLRSKTYDFNIDGYKSSDISLKAEHLLADKIVGMAYQNQATPIVWMRTATGKLIGMTYLPQHDIIAFHHHETQGLYDSMCTIPGVDREELWVCVKRTINGTVTRYIEQFQTESWTDVDDAYYSDSAIAYNGVATTTFSGAEHLEGMDCVVFADGAVLPNVTVSGGAFTTQFAAEKVILGLGYDAVLATMPLVPPIEMGTSQGKPKALWKTTIQVKDTIGLKVGSSVDNLDDVYFRSSADLMDQGIPLFTGQKQIEYIKGFDASQKIVCVSDQPLPCTILSISPVFYASPV